MWPLTVRVVGLVSTDLSDTKASCTVVSPAVVPGGVSGKRMLMLSPGRMSGVTARLVPLPQQTPPGWFTSKATSPPDTTACADPTIPTPARCTSNVAVSPWCPL